MLFIVAKVFASIALFAINVAQITLPFLEQTRICLQYRRSERHLCLSVLGAYEEKLISSNSSKLRCETILKEFDNSSIIRFFWSAFYTAVSSTKIRVD